MLGLEEHLQKVALTLGDERASSNLAASIPPVCRPSLDLDRLIARARWEDSCLLMPMVQLYSCLTC